MKHFLWALVLPIALAGMVACGDDDDDLLPPTTDTDTFDLTVEGDASFQEPHGGDAVHVDLMDSDGEIVVSQSGTVSATEDPSFSFTFAEVLEEDQDYTVEYWIDSATEGTEGVCDPDADYRQQVELTAVSGDELETVAFDETATTSCENVAFTLELSGDATFQGAHGGQPIEVAVVHEGLDAVVATQSGTVAVDGEESFSFTFENVLTRNADYHVDVWIDSNLDDGTAGTCDEPEDDHQWRIDSEMEEALAGVSADVSFQDTHRPAEVEDVCATFEG